MSLNQELTVQRLAYANMRIEQETFDYDDAISFIEGLIELHEADKYIFSIGDTCPACNDGTLCSTPSSIVCESCSEIFNE